MSISQNELKDLFSYDPLSGFLCWKNGRSNMVKGSRAGCVNKSGYMIITINSKSYRLSRVIWIFMFGSIPDGFYIDHINGNKTDNRLCNLRVVSNKQNQENRPAPRNTTSGYRGVNWHSSYKKWMARICHNKKRETIGFFDTAEEAYQAYKNRALQIYTHADRLP